MSSFVTRAGQIGSIVRDGKEVCQQYEWFCLRHPKPTKMLKSISESFEKVGQRPNTVEKKLIVSGAHCPRCGQFVKEGDWYE